MWRQSQGDGEPPNWTDMERRKEAVSRWLQAAIADTPFVPGQSKQAPHGPLRLLPSLS